MAAPAIESLSLVEEQFPDTDLEASKPSGTAEGDLLLAFVCMRANPTITPPSGWALIEDVRNSALLAVYYKVAGSSEPSTYTFSVSTTDSRPTALAIVRISGADTSNPINASDGVTDSGVTDLTCPSVTTTVNDCLLIRACNVEGGDYTWSEPSGYTMRLDGTTYAGGNSGGCDPTFADIEFATAGSTGTLDYTHNEPYGPFNANGVAVTIAIAPAAGGGDTFTGTAAATFGAATCSASGEFDPPVYTGTAALTIGAAACSGSGLFAAEIYSGTAALTAPAASCSAAGEHTPPTYTGAAELTAPAATASGSGEHDPPTYTGTLAAVVGAAVCAASGSFETLTRTGTAALVAPAATCAGLGDGPGDLAVPKFPGGVTVHCAGISVRVSRAGITCTVERR
jgi:hypothetical protein